MKNPTLPRAWIEQVLSAVPGGLDPGFFDLCCEIQIGTEFDAVNLPVFRQHFDELLRIVGAWGGYNIVLEERHYDRGVPLVAFETRYGPCVPWGILLNGVYQPFPCPALRPVWLDPRLAEPQLDWEDDEWAE